MFVSLVCFSFFFLWFLIQVDFALFIQNIPGIRNKCQLINLKVSLAVFSCLVCLFMHAVITLRITVFTLYLCGQVLEKPRTHFFRRFFFFNTDNQSSPILEKVEGAGEGAYFTVNAVLVAKKLEGD